MPVDMPSLPVKDTTLFALLDRWWADPPAAILAPADWYDADAPAPVPVYRSALLFAAAAEPVAAAARVDDFEEEPPELSDHFTLAFLPRAGEAVCLVESAATGVGDSPRLSEGASSSSGGRSQRVSPEFEK